MHRTDARAALGVVNRRGVGTTRHTDSQELWLKSAIRNRELEVQKVAGEQNVADILTKCVKSEVLEKHMAGWDSLHQDQKTRDGRCVDGCTGAVALAGAQEQFSSQSASAAPKAVGALCNESGSNRSGSSSGRTAISITTRECDELVKALGANARSGSRSALCPVSPWRSTTIKTLSTTDYLRWARQRRRLV